MSSAPDEARWAVFFDALDIPWEYEKEGYDLGEAGWYLPDFWLPQQQCFFEVKGTVADFPSKLKAFYLSFTLQQVVIVSSGTMGLRATTANNNGNPSTLLVQRHCPTLLSMAVP